MPLPLMPMRPVLFEKIWGGDKLAKAGKALADGRKLGESWEVADLPEGSSTIAAGPLAGKSLTEVTREFGEELVGPGHRGRFPLLVKVIDAADDLSVQVHPGQHNVGQLEGAASKDEAWIIVDTDPGARILHGLVGGVAKGRLRQAVAGGCAHELLRSVEMRPGDVVRVPPGTFHAIGRGTMLVEVQEPSDATYRVWDFGRVGLDGRPRELHLDQALAVGNFDEQPKPIACPRPVGDRHELLIDAPSYRIERVFMGAGELRVLELPSEGPVVIVPCAAPVMVGGHDGARVELDALETVVVPASHDRIEISCVAAATVLVTGLGGRSLARIL